MYISLAGRRGITPPRNAGGRAGAGGSHGAAPASVPPPPRAAGMGWRSEGVKGRRLGNLMLTKPQECCTFPFPSSFRRRLVPAAGSRREEHSPEAALAPAPPRTFSQVTPGRDGTGVKSFSWIWDAVTVPAERRERGIWGAGFRCSAHPGLGRRERGICPDPPRPLFSCRRGRRCRGDG